MLKNLKNKLNDNNGFSLVELIVVIAIMVILIAMLVPNVVGYINRATSATEQQAAATIFSAAQTYATDCFAKGSAASSISEDDLVNAQLLAKASGYSGVDISINATNKAIVDQVSFTSNADGSTVRYPAN